MNRDRENLDIYLEDLSVLEDLGFKRFNDHGIGRGYVRHYKKFDLHVHAYPHNGGYVLSAHTEPPYGTFSHILMFLTGQDADYRQEHVLLNYILSGGRHDFIEGFWEAGLS